MFTKKHYEAIARVIRSSVEYADFAVKGGDRDWRADQALADLVDELCPMFKQDNPQFKPDKFKQACGLEEKHAASS